MNNILFALLLLSAAIVINSAPPPTDPEDNSNQPIQPSISDSGHSMKNVFAYLETKDMLSLRETDKNMKATVDKWTIKPSPEMLFHCPKEWNKNIFFAPSKQPYSYSQTFYSDNFQEIPRKFIAECFKETQKLFNEQNVKGEFNISFEAVRNNVVDIVIWPQSKEGVSFSLVSLVVESIDIDGIDCI